MARARRTHAPHTLLAATLALNEMQASFDLRWEADMRAIRRWQAAHPGRDLVWPDHADLVVWLMEQLEAVPPARSVPTFTYASTRRPGSHDRCSEHGDIGPAESIVAHLRAAHGLTYSQWQALTELEEER